MVLSKAIGIPNTVVRNGGHSDYFSIFFDMLVSHISQRASVKKGAISENIICLCMKAMSVSVSLPSDSDDSPFDNFDYHT